MSAYLHPHVINDKLSQEISLGRMAGPFAMPPFSDFQCSPIGLVPKSTPGEYRLIHDLSYPKGASINSEIPREYTTVQYDTLDTFLAFVKTCGPGALMAKTDIKSAFRLIPVHPDHYKLLGIYWRNQYYYDCCLPFGCSASPQLFERFSHALQHVLDIELQVPYS